MVADGLNPAKKSSIFYPLWTKIRMSTFISGTIAIAKRYGKLANIAANVIYENDEFTFEIDVETGYKKIKSHVSSIDNIGGKIKGAYAVCTLTDGTTFAEIMSVQQIQKSWDQGIMKGGSPAHKNFEDQMCLKLSYHELVRLLLIVPMIQYYSRLMNKIMLIYYQNQYKMILQRMLIPMILSILIILRLLN